MNMFIFADKLPRNIILTDDVMRVEMLAAHYLNDARLVSESRGMRSYAGTYKDVPVAAVACGFGRTAAMLHLKEAHGLGAGNVVYIGECISLTERYALMDNIIPNGYGAKLSQNLKAAANAKNVKLHFTDVRTDDGFLLSRIKPEHCEVIDFAHEGLCVIADDLGVEMISLLVVSENARTGERIEENVRQSGFHIASQLAFEAIIY